MNLNESEMRDTAARICRDYLTGVWRTIAPSELQFKRISGGLSNFLYHVALPSSPPGSPARCPSPPGSPHGNGGTTSTYTPQLSHGEPKQVLLRIYGQVHGEQAIEAIITESVVFTLLSERRLGPKLHGVFPGGRIEQYIPARPLTTTELSDPVLSVKIAEKMAAIHSMDVPLSKEPDWLWKTMTRWMQTVENNLNNYKKKNDHESRLVQKIKSHKLRSEMDWLRQYLETVESPVVFSHNDMQEGNILLRENLEQTQDFSQNSIIKCETEDSNSEIFYAEEPIIEDDGIAVDFSQQMALKEDRKDSDSFFDSQNRFNNKEDDTMDCESTTDSVLSGSSSNVGDADLVLIDFEYCSYNYRGFDLANHFIEWSYDYSEKNHPYFYDRPEHYPTQEQQERFITAYLQSSRRYHNGHTVRARSSPISHSSRSGHSSRSSVDSVTRNSPPTSKDIEKILEEVRAFTLASHLFWGMWASVNASLSQIPFGYWDYANSRLDRYFDLKQNIVPLKSTLKRKINDID